MATFYLLADCIVTDFKTSFFVWIIYSANANNWLHTSSSAPSLPYVSKVISVWFSLQCFDTVGWAAGKAGMVICLEQGADLHMAQLMPLPLTVSCFSKIQITFTFWYRLTGVVPDKRPLNKCVYLVWFHYCQCDVGLIRKVISFSCRTDMKLVIAHNTLDCSSITSALLSVMSNWLCLQLPCSWILWLPSSMWFLRVLHLLYQHSFL